MGQCQENPVRCKLVCGTSIFDLSQACEINRQFGWKNWVGLGAVFRLNRARTTGSGILVFQQGGYYPRNGLIKLAHLFSCEPGI